MQRLWLFVALGISCCSTVHYDINVGAILHLGTHHTCRVDVAGIVPYARTDHMYKALIRVPLHVLRSARSAAGTVVTGNTTEDTAWDADYQQWAGNPSTTIVEWRTLLIVAFGCGAHYPGEKNTDCNCK